MKMDSCLIRPCGPKKSNGTWTKSVRVRVRPLVLLDSHGSHFQPTTFCGMKPTNQTNKQTYCRFTNGDMTFEEAYRRTGRIFCITLSSTCQKAPPVLINYLSAPHVTIASAVLASSAVPGFIPPVRLQYKDSKGVIRNYGQHDQTYYDGTCVVQFSPSAVLFLCLSKCGMDTYQKATVCRVLLLLRFCVLFHSTTIIYRFHSTGHSHQWLGGNLELSLFYCLAMQSTHCSLFLQSQGRCGSSQSMVQWRTRTFLARWLFVGRLGNVSQGTYYSVSTNKKTGARGFPESNSQVPLFVCFMS